MNTKDLQIQAEYYSNIAILDRSFKSSVYLEDESDIYFWDIMLQKHRPGKYYYICHTKKGKTPGGCKECLKFRNFLSDRFFICIDSDLKYLSKEKDINAQNFILQTYTYSWENHFCYAPKLQKSMLQRFPLIAQRFNFISKIRKAKSVYIDCLEKNYYKEMGINEENAYLHIRGHYIYNLIKFIGKQLCRKENINFEKDILLDLQTSDYWQIDRIKEDIKQL